MSKRLDSFNFKVDPGFKMYFQSCLNLCEYGTVVGDCINTMKTTLYSNFDLYQAASIDTINTEVKRSC